MSQELSIEEVRERAAELQPKLFQNNKTKYIVTWYDGTTNEYELKSHHVMNLTMCSLVKCVEKKFND